MVNGSESFSRSFMSRVAKTARICSKRSATSLPFFSPASVITTKCVERISSQGDFSSVAAKEDEGGEDKLRIKASAEIGMELPRGMRMPPKNATHKMLTRRGFEGSAYCCSPIFRTNSAKRGSECRESS